MIVLKFYVVLCFIICVSYITIKTNLTIVANGWDDKFPWAIPLVNFMQMFVGGILLYCYVKMC